MTVHAIKGGWVSEFGNISSGKYLTIYCLTIAHDLDVSRSLNIPKRSIGRRRLSTE
jgi:hypothetical protein